MLKPLHTSKIDRALKLLGLNEAGAYASVTFDTRGVSTTYVGLKGWTPEYWSDENPDLYLRAIRNLYGGDLDKVVRIVIFGGGYEVHTLTDVVNRKGNGFVCEIKVGRIVN